MRFSSKQNGRHKTGAILECGYQGVEKSRLAP